jgi:hypothetical protein
MDEKACTGEPDHRERMRRPALRPPSRLRVRSGSCHLLRRALGRPPPAATFPPSSQEPRPVGSSGWVSREIPRISGETAHATCRFWNHMPSIPAGHRARARTNSCKVPCHHHSRTWCSGMWPLRISTRKVAGPVMAPSVQGSGTLSRQPSLGSRPLPLHCRQGPRANIRGIKPRNTRSSTRLLILLAIL